MLMEFPSSRISTNPQVSPSIPFLTWKGRRNPSTLTIPNSKRQQLSIYVSRPIPCRNFRISAHFGRASSRQNYLRKKLTQQQKQQQQQQVSEDLVYEFDKVHTYESSFETLNSEGGSSVSQNEGVEESEKELTKKKIGESIMWNKLEGWVEQYKKDSQFWGIGTGPIFSVFQDSEGKVERVVVNEDEIMRRSRIDTQLDNETEVLAEVDFKISFAKDLAREMEKGGNVIPKNSSVAKFLRSSGAEESRLVGAVRGATVMKPVSFPSMSRVGVLVLFGLSMIWAIRGLLTVGDDSRGEYTAFEKEMLRRKMKARKEEEKKMVKGSVEVMQVPIEPKGMSIKRPQLDKEELISSIIKAKGSNGQPDQTFESELEGKIKEIRAMARHAREIERRDALQKSSSHNATSENELPSEDEVSVTDTDDDDIELSINEASDDKCETKFHNIIPNGTNSLRSEASNEKKVSAFSNLTDANVHSDGSAWQSQRQQNTSPKKLRIIKSAKEAKEEYLSRKYQTPEVNQNDDVGNNKHSDSPSSSLVPTANVASSFLGNVQDSESMKVDAAGQLKAKKVPEDTAKMSAFATANEVNDIKKELAPLVSKENWMEKNFHEFEPVVDKIGAGFRDSYQLAKEKASLESGSETDLAQLKCDDAESELEWMKDERLREIVFKVRDNELSGRDPFHLMDEEDKATFFSGLEKKVEQENTKLLKLHEYLHSNIENLDYGADGISVYDPPEKIIPRWKVPPAERNHEFLNNFVEQKKELVTESLKSSFLSRKTAKEAVNKSEKLSSLKNGAVAADNSDHLESSKTIIESSDGSVRAGKRLGKEFWQHTKKWSEGFLESYNAESDPEAKAAMRDIGKDLDRWITEKEIKEASELMEKLPEKAFIKQKLNKVRREMEFYGPQAVVSKYREYAEEKEEDYLWWLDLPHVLCIELYTVEDGEERAGGFYSLEMAADLELDPKPYHVIAFEDAGDCKNLCYIIQAKMEVLGNGNAFVVARPPKDAYREAKANGFSVTVIKKGQLQLNVDQTLEEVQESITEIGSKIYHDSITKERSVDVKGLMKGVFGITKPTNRNKSKRKSKRQIKP